MGNKYVSIFKREGIFALIDHSLKKLGFQDLLILDERNYKKWIEMDASYYPQELKKWYYIHTGKLLNLDEPHTFNEKLQWLKLYDTSAQKTLLADKYLMRTYIKDTVGEDYLIPLLGVWDSFDEIDFSKLPESFVLKANHGSGWNVIVKENKFDIVESKRKFDKWMRTNFAFVSGFELHYKDIVPKIIAEQYIENINGLIDYRIYCFHGVPTHIWVDIYSGTLNHKREIYDMDWVRLSVKCTWPSRADGISYKKPENFDKMKMIASLLSKDFIFVRIDFYEVDGCLFIGEMTFIPMGGVGKFEPDSFNIYLGNLLFLH